MAYVGTPGGSRSTGCNCYSCREYKMKTGDIVKVTDLSGALVLRHGDMQTAYGEALRTTEWVIVAVGCTLPVRQPTFQERNNTICHERGNGSVLLFTQERLLRLATPEPEPKPVEYTCTSEYKVVIPKGVDTLIVEIGE